MSRITQGLRVACPPVTLPRFLFRRDQRRPRPDAPRQHSGSAHLYVRTSGYRDKHPATAYIPPEFITVSPDGRLIALKPEPASVDVVQLSLLPVTDFEY